MSSRHLIRGRARQGDHPAWEPLEQLLGSDELCGRFMWMFDVELEDGSVLNAYKHYDTRRYFHLCDDGRAFNYAGDELYTRVDRETAIRGVFAGPGFHGTASERLALLAALESARRSG